LTDHEAMGVLKLMLRIEEQDRKIVFLQDVIDALHAERPPPPRGSPETLGDVLFDALNAPVHQDPRTLPTRHEETL
jgi:hypothetical protein